MRRTAEISACGQYRYLLTRMWGGWRNGRRTVCFIGLNPSTADAEIDDPTVRRLIGFAKLWDFDGLQLVNLFALRSTDPKQLRQRLRPVGPDNDEWIIRAATSSELTVVCWGADKAAERRSQDVYRLLRDNGIPHRCFGTTKAGFPKHPLYLAAATRLEDVE